MKPTKAILLCLILAFTVAVGADEKPKAVSKPAPISVTDEATKRAVQDSYSGMVMATKDFQIAILQARVKYRVPEDWKLDLATLTFVPPEPAPEKSKP